MNGRYRVRVARRLALAAGVLAVALAGLIATASPTSAAPRLHGALLYVANDNGTITAYQIGTWRRVARWTGLPI